MEIANMVAEGIQQAPTLKDQDTLKENVVNMMQDEKTAYNNSSPKCTISFRPCSNNKMHHLLHHPILTINLLPMPCHNSSTACLPIPTT
eukprot:14555749-Ditylum_brightwellii.AAC.1